ncbi:hypothetical protein NW754_008805 [Fusarium falciforme]|nr:hypothetical protein NW754_008805 [Fusarium falciforme]
MSPPPSTPTPRRFLLAKRGATQSSQTPTGPPRFQSTPRFGSSSVPRPTQSRTIVDIEDVEEVDDLVEESSSNTDDEGLETRKHAPLNDSIEVEDDDVTASRDGSVGISISEDDEEEMPRRSIERESPELLNLPHDTSPLEERAQAAKSLNLTNARVKPSWRTPLSKRQQPPRYGREGAHAYAEFGRESAGRHPNTRRGQGTPTANLSPAAAFQTSRGRPHGRRPPRGLFPQRRGAKYVAGGLAAGLQGWLSEVKGWEGTVPSAAAAVSVVKVVVEEVRPGRRMYLVTGRAGDDGAALARRFLLAGEGRLTGLGQRAAVTVGNVVEVGQPVWDVELDGQVWTVACDWGVS